MGSAREPLRVGFTSLILSVKRRNAEAGRGLGVKIRCLEKIVSLLKGGGDVEVSNGRGDQGGQSTKIPGPYLLLVLQTPSLCLISEGRLCSALGEVSSLRESSNTVSSGRFLSSLSIPSSPWAGPVCGWACPLLRSRGSLSLPCSHCCCSLSKCREHSWHAAGLDPVWMASGVACREGEQTQQDVCFLFDLPAGHRQAHDHK